MTLYLSRFRLSGQPSVAALSALIDPSERGERQDAHHRLIWSAFAGDPNAPRDFLWRAIGKGRFLVLSARPPGDSPFFDVDTKPFAPDLRSGDQLWFELRANATRTEKTGELSANGRERKRHIDLVMDHLHDLPAGTRAPHRMDAAQKAATEWIARQAARSGFESSEVTASDYSTVALPQGRGRRKGNPQFGVIDMTGRLEVTDPEAFVAAIARGFGRAKAFGCGLMLIRRAE